MLSLATDERGRSNSLSLQRRLPAGHRPLNGVNATGSNGRTKDGRDGEPYYPFSGQTGAVASGAHIRFPETLRRILRLVHAPRNLVEILQFVHGLSVKSHEFRMPCQSRVSTEGHLHVGGRDMGAIHEL